MTTPVTADKTDVIEPVDMIVYFGNDGRCYQSQGCSILGLLEFRRWHKILVNEVEKIGLITEAQPLLATARFMDFYYLSLEPNPDALPEVFPDWVQKAEDEAIASGVTDEDDQSEMMDEILQGYIEQVSDTLREFDFGGTLAIACESLLRLNGIEPATLSPKTFYQMLFDHVDNKGYFRHGKLITLNTPSPIKKKVVEPHTPSEPPSEVDPAYQAIAGLVNVTQDLEKALNIAEKYPAKLVNGVATAIVEQQDRQRVKSGEKAQAPRQLTQDELDEALNSMGGKTTVPQVPSAISPEQKLSLLSQIASPH